jgi:Ser/Thr protein kinase RdoA (MazF antagonist)
MKNAKRTPSDTIYQEAIAALFPGDNTCTIERVNNGLINTSYKITPTGHSGSIFLQLINQHVFKKPEQVQDNYMQLWNYKVVQAKDLSLPAPVYFHEQKSLFIDAAENYWRAFTFIGNAKTLNVPENAEQAMATAKTFGQLTASLAKFDITRLHIVIPHFHDLTFRYNQFTHARSMAAPERLQKAIDQVDSLQRRSGYKDFYERIINSPDFPKRVMHHDAKIANVLFDKTSGKVICAVDFDTVMPGYFYSDLGDMIRSMACSEDENSTAFDQIYIRKDFYTAIVNGYLDVMREQLTELEKKTIHYAGLAMVYMQALRFLTDYLSGDYYYKISYPEQNFDRAQNQLILLKNLEAFLKSEYNFTLLNND